MKAPLLLAGLALGLSAYAALSTFQRSAPGDAAPSDGSAASPSDPDGHGLLVEQLRSDLERLRARIDALEMSASLRERREPQAQEPVTRAELEALEQELAALTGAGGADGSRAAPRVDGVEFKQAVQDSLREIELEEAREAGEKWADARYENLAGRLPEAAEKLGLASTQTNRLESSLGRLYDAQAGYGSLKASGEVQTAEQWEQLIERDMGQFFGELEGFLSADQLELYLTLGDGWAFPGSEAGGKGGAGS